ncbi:MULTISPECIES: tyrosine-type recombinase/integrase [Streptomyces]|uniref:Site-specific recombinase XerD n=1 Tax=Streptomyces chartreusis NRRL 3882 TaxID=1079985 RepID=A0A2N9B9W2_STRCX|nr:MULTISPECIES: site-specific integrase [Streptomyces]MYS93815.1 tyrosine-type recombinase/integrase [Streptomyces sp. SID5464]SOR80124.1 Site-specific recombinase XerD [Streptomyces chartreusis NRRL 3882]
MTTTVLTAPAKAPRKLAGAEAAALLEKFPPRERAASWPMTEADSEYILDTLQQPPFRVKRNAQVTRMVGARIILSWLQTFPGSTWQACWDASPAAHSPSGWHRDVIDWAANVGRKPTTACLASGTLALICVDAIRPTLAWLAASTSGALRPAIAATRDPDGFARLEAQFPEDIRSTRHASAGLQGVSRLIAAFGGLVKDIVVGDLLALLQATDYDAARGVRIAYTALRDLGQFPPDAPATLLRLQTRAGQVTPAALVDRYELRCRPVRDLLVDYLTERQPSLDHNSLITLSSALANNFWADLERHNEGISSLHLPAEVAAAWKARVNVVTRRRRMPDGQVVETTTPRSSAPAVKTLVRAFYLDIAQWALDEPARWGPWAAPCPITEADCSDKKTKQRQKTTSDQRTRERLPVLPALIRVADRRLKEARARLDALHTAPLGSRFTVLGETYTAPKSTSRAGLTGQAYDTSGRRRDLEAEEKRAFWGWATIEILRHTGIRIEELLELGHHSIIRYKLPSTGEFVPLLQIAPSKTDQERLLLVTPELADVLSAVVTRVRGKNGAIPSVPSYDLHEKVWNDPMPLLYQWSISGERRPISHNTVRDALNDVLLATGLTDATGNPLKFQPHDFRRIFITDAILNGLPPHIAQVIAGHSNINTTMGYNAVYPAKAIEAHRAFIARRRSLRPREEYRAVTSEEWQEFLTQFERRKLALGSCGRAYGTDCVHEHACVRCPVLIVDPYERGRLVEIRDNLNDRIAEAEREGWLGEVEGLSVSRDAAEEKIAQLDARQKKKDSPIFLGVPSFSQIAVRTSSATNAT